MPDIFVRGQGVVWRSLPGGSIGTVMPVTVVCDGAGIVGLFQQTGSIRKRRTGKRGGPGDRVMLEWDGGHTDSVWSPPRSNLHLHKLGTKHKVTRSWNEQLGVYEGWYVNIETDWTRTPIGFDSWDMILDVTVTQDLSSWALKDEDELDWAEQQGIVSHEQADEARREAAIIGHNIERGAWPFFDDWSGWAPDPSWQIPVSPENWNELF
jgi:uncharacterized protein